MDDETLIDEAPEGQPSAEAVAETPSVEPGSESVESAPDAGQPVSRLYAGKYKSDEELEHAFLESQREASRMAGELAAYRKGLGTQPATPSATPSQIDKYETERGKWEQYAAREDISMVERTKALSQISRYDREIGKLEAQSEWESKSNRQSASRALEGDAQAVFETYQADLSPGSSLYQAAEQRYAQMLRAGYPDAISTKADAVLWAAHKTGAAKSKVVQKDRTGFLDNLNKQAKAAVRAGAGTATPVKSGAITAKNIEQMSDAEFAKYERELSLGV